MPDEQTQDDSRRVYEMQIGGVYLYKEGHLITEAEQCVRYRNLNYAKVQQLWALMAEDPAIRKAIQDFDAAIKARMQEVGDEMGIAKGRMTPAEKTAKDDIRKKLSQL